jgi:hypothetical protein
MNQIGQYEPNSHNDSIHRFYSPKKIKAFLRCWKTAKQSTTQEAMDMHNGWNKIQASLNHMYFITLLTEPILNSP